MPREYYFPKDTRTDAQKKAARNEPCCYNCTSVDLGKSPSWCEKFSRNVVVTDTLKCFETKWTQHDLT